MIGRLRGTVLEKNPPYLLLDVMGLGYEVQVSMTTFYHLPDVGVETTLHTHFVVREDGHYLYGFFDVSERSLFRTLIKVNGVGPKLALTVLSSIEPAQFIRCIADNDTHALVRLPGVGKKIAERLVIEMRDKLADWHLIPSEVASFDHAVNDVRRTATHEAISALVALGYKPQEASRAIGQVNLENATSETLIRHALKNAVKI